MSLPDIAFECIRPFNGSRHDGFEELCCQLASMEPRPSGATFHRKGQGGDAGVECFLRRVDGTEIGWQAKYLFSWDSSCATQLDNSVRAALDKHPQLEEYVVCLPFNLPDSRPRTGSTALKKWEDWCTKWKKNANRQNRNLRIKLWDKSQLCIRLTKTNPAHAGRVLYWFGIESLTAEWFREHFNQAKSSLGARYMPEINVELPIRQGFVAFARHPEIQVQIDRWCSHVANKGRLAVREIRVTPVETAHERADSLADEIHKLRSLLGEGPIEPHQSYPIDHWSSAAQTCINIARDTLHWSFNLSDSTLENIGSDSIRSTRHVLQDLIELLKEVEEVISSDHWRLANAKAILLQGPAGIGKSHFLADIVDQHLIRGGPATLLLGGAFIDAEPWPQIRDQLDRPPTEQFRHFLGALDAAAQAAGLRAIICIDALNERHGIEMWPERIAAFLATFEPFPRIGVILSCRSTYVPHVIPDTLGGEKLLRIDHKGFSGDGGRAAKTYLDMRGIVRPGAPNLVLEFENPLFLKTCCDSLEKAGVSELPRGVQGVTSIFEFYNKATTQALNRRMQLDPHQEIVPKAISAFAQLLAESGKGYAEKATVVNLFEELYPSAGKLRESLFLQLESEGLLAVELMPQDTGPPTEMVRFTFERYSDHAIAARLLDDHLDESNVVDCFGSGLPLGDVLSGPGSYRRSGIIEAIAIQLPERTCMEIPDVATKPSMVVHRAFKESLLWREQRSFTDSTFDLVRKLMSIEELQELLVSIGTEPSNKFNAFYLHQKLVDMTMPERDERWSSLLAKRGLVGHVETLISWAIQSELEQVDEDRAHLAATMLSWFLTTSHREVRDKATKALACLLSRRLSLAARLLNQFSDVNDPYLLERLFAACYGAALQGQGEADLGELAQTTFDTIFAHGKPPPDALLRDHARGILEYAAWCNVQGLSVDLDLARPPYQSPWPIEQVPDELISSYTEDLGRGPTPDLIVGSTVYYGDFARYQIDYMLEKWSPAALGTETLPTSHDVRLAWCKEFSHSASTDQTKALSAYVSAAREAEHARERELTLQKERLNVGDTSIAFVHGSPTENSPEKERLSAAELVLQRAMSTEQWEEFRVQAMDDIRQIPFNGSRQYQSAKFNLQWGRRWICKRAHELGWTPERFGEFDNFYHSRDRTDHRIERIGKKYQWLALHELIARMADNLAYHGDPWEQVDNTPPVYRGSQQVGLRNIDPSLLICPTDYNDWQEAAQPWWIPFNPRLRPMSPHERIAWLESDSDVINDSCLIDLRNPATNRRWLALWGYSDWTGSGVRGGGEYQRTTWFRLTCIVVDRGHQSQMIEKLRDKILTNPRALPTIELPHHFYLGEYPWHPDMEDFEWWSSDKDLNTPDMPIRTTVSRYLCENSGYNYSIDRTININLPAPWLAESMGLRLANGRSPAFVDSSGQDVFCDPSILEPGPSAALVDREPFLDMLNQQNLSAIWVIAGEKSVHGGHEVGSGFGGCIRHTAIYHYDNDHLVRHLHTDREYPNRDQLEAMFGVGHVPSELLKGLNLQNRDSIRTPNSTESSTASAIPHDATE